MNEPDYLVRLDPDQHETAMAPMGLVCTPVGAGTGKTRAIAHRIKYLIDQGFVQPQKVLTVIFTSHAVGEIRDRLIEMGTPGVQARTFHSAALRQLRYFWSRVAGDMPWQLLDGKKFRAVAQAVRRVGLDTSKETIRDVIGEIEWVKATPAGADQCQATLQEHKRMIPPSAEKIIDCCRAYEDIRTTPNGLLLDLDDSFTHIAGTMRNSRAMAEEFRDQYQCFVVDEYQDITPLQQQVLNTWLGDRDNLTVVEDANQTIYSLTGTIPQYLMNFSRDYPETTVVRLQRGYRSTPQVIELANNVIGRVQGHIAGSQLKLIEQRQDGSEPTFNQYDDEPMKARAATRNIKRLIDTGTPTSEIAVLYCINVQSVVFEQILSEVGVVYQVHGGDGLYQCPEIRDAVATLVRAFRPSRIVPILQGANLLDLVKQVFAGFSMTDQEPEGVGTRGRWQSLRVLSDLCKDVVHTNIEVNIQVLLDQLHIRQQAEHPPTLGGATPVSLHAAKGLERDAVFLVGLTDGSPPIQHTLSKFGRSSAQGAKATGEERRLFCVGTTRAHKHLELSWPLSWTEGGRRSRRRTRFLDELDTDVSDYSAVAHRSSRSSGSRSKRRQFRQCKGCTRSLHIDAERISGRCEGCPVSAGPALLEALRTWRLEASREITVPTFVTFSDTTLPTIGEQQLTTPGEFLQIPGIGRAKLGHLDEGILGIVNSFANS